MYKIKNRNLLISIKIQDFNLKKRAMKPFSHSSKKYVFNFYKKEINELIEKQWLQPSLIFLVFFIILIENWHMYPSMQLLIAGFKYHIQTKEIIEEGLIFHWGQRRQNMLAKSL